MWSRNRKLGPFQHVPFRIAHMSRSVLNPTMSQMISQIRTDKVDGVSVSMFQALHKSSLSKSTDPKDKVFALLGLSFDKMVYVAEPTYSWTHRELCVRMTMSFFKSKKFTRHHLHGPEKLKVVTCTTFVVSGLYMLLIKSQYTKPCILYLWTRPEV